MGRSVDYPSDASVVVYISLDLNCEFDCGDEWEYFVDGVKDVVRGKYPSFIEADRWSDRELHVILENDFAEVVISEYCGLVSVSLVAKEDVGYYSDSASLAALGNAWASKVSDNFKKLLDKSFGGLEKAGTFSNGESFYIAA